MKPIWGIVLFGIGGVLSYIVFMKNGELDNYNYVFSRYLLLSFQYQRINYPQLFLYVLSIRMPFFTLAPFFTMGKHRAIFIALLSGASGFIVGFLFLHGIAQYGGNFVIYLLGMLLPQIIFYMVSIWQLFHIFSNHLHGEKKWKKWIKYYGIVMLGVLSETFLNPMMLSLFVGIL